MCGRSTLLDSPDMQDGVFQVRLLPAKVDQLRSSETVPEGQQHLVASRWPQRLSLAASISRSTSRSVRCSRNRYAAFGFRRGRATAHFSEVGPTILRCRTARIFRSPDQMTAYISRLPQPVDQEKLPALMSHFDSPAEARAPCRN